MNVARTRISKRLASHSLYSLMIAVVFACGVADADIIVRNDSIPVGGSNNPLLAFVPGEQAASWFISPTAGDIVGVQIQWDSIFGTNPTSTEMFVNIYGGGTFPTPGPLLAQIPFPLLSDGSANEMRHLDPPVNSVPLSIPVTSGQAFVVALEFLNQNAGTVIASGVEIDQDGITPNANSVFAIPGGWLDAGPVGVTGDFGIRAIVRPVPEPASGILIVGLALILAVRRPEMRRQTKAL